MRNAHAALALVSLSTFSVFSVSAEGDFNSIPDKQIINAKAQIQREKLPELTATSADSISAQDISNQQLQQNFALTEKLLNQAIIQNQSAAIADLLTIYQQFPQQDPILVRFAQAKLAKAQGDYEQAIALFEQILAIEPKLTPIRIELAIALLQDQQNKAAAAQFAKAQQAADLPADIKNLLTLYQQILQQRESWQFDFSLNYVRSHNVNNVSNQEFIEQTGFKKGEEMLPQKAQGLAFSANLSRTYNFYGHHYWQFENASYGKIYWDNHSFDDMSNRSYLGYAYKTAHSQSQFLPFYERQWYGGHRYKWAQGLRLAHSHWLNPQIQLSLALEYSKNRYFTHSNLNGHSQLLSSTLLWTPTDNRYFWLGADFGREHTNQRHYSYDLKTVRIGWGENWPWFELASRFSFSYSQRQYRDNLRLGNVLQFDRARKDQIFALNTSLWKRDWQLFGITPKLNFQWKKQRSNFPSLYSYHDQQIYVLFEKSF